MHGFNHTKLVRNVFLGTVEWQNLTEATLTDLLVYGLFFFEGIIMMFGNALLVCVILAYKALRRKEMYVIAGLAVGDLLYGIGFFFAGIRRFSLALEGKHMWKVTPWSCMGAIQNLFFILGSQAAAFMLVVVSADRLLAVRKPSYYVNLGTRYAKTILVVTYGYCIITVPVVALLSAYKSNPTPSVPAICISTHVGPGWFSSYQPTIQMTCGTLSVVIYCATWFFFRNQIQSITESEQSLLADSQRKMTRTVGVTVLFTFFCYVLPHSIIFFFNTFQASKHLAGLMSPYGWVISNINSIVNICILGIRNKEIQCVLRCWFRCKKPEFSGAGAEKSNSAEFTRVNKSTRVNPPNVHSEQLTIGNGVRAGHSGPWLNKQEGCTLPGTSRAQTSKPQHMTFFRAVLS